MICENNKCCGCGLCASKCPAHAIKMSADREGFLHPHINEELCVSCDLCRELCPVLKAEDEKNEFDVSGIREIDKNVKAYSAYKTEIEDLLKSSAGGIANAIGRVIIKAGGVVFGVKYKSDYRGAEYSIAKNNDELNLFNESKYVEVDRSYLFSHIEDELKNSPCVLVIGLPCDIAAVRALVGYPDNLYTCRLICRSNTSNKALNEFIDNWESKTESTLSKLSLRYKEKGRPTLPTRYRIEFKNGNVHMEDFVKSDYGKAFQIFARPSCLSCFAKKRSIDSDLIIGDFQGLNPKDDLYDISGVSIVFCFTGKGRELLDKVEGMKIEEADLKNTWKYNWMIYTSIPESPFRKDFSERFYKSGLRFACHQLCVEQNRILDDLCLNYKKTGKKVAVWGAGDTAEYLYDRLDMNDWNIIKIFDSSPMKIGKAFKNHVIDSINDINTISNEIDALILMIPSENEKKLEDFVREKGYLGKIIHVGKNKFYREEP